MKNESFVPSSEQQTIMKAFAKVFEYSVDKYDLVDFALKALQTKIFANFDYDFTINQKPYDYIVDKIAEELSLFGVSIKEASKEQKLFILGTKETAYWLGYLLMFWKHAEKISPSELVKYDYNEIIWGYEILHMQSVQNAIQIIKQEYELEKER